MLPRTKSCFLPCNNEIGQQLVAADAGGSLRLSSVAFGPARLHVPLGLRCRVKPSVHHGLSQDAVSKLVPKEYLLPPSIPEPISLIFFRNDDTVESGRLRRALAALPDEAADPSLLIVGRDFTLESCRLAADRGAHVVATGMCQWSDELCERTSIWKGARVKKPAW